MSDMDNNQGTSCENCEDDSGSEESICEDGNNDACNILVYPDSGYNVVPAFRCPLRKSADYTLATVRESAERGCASCIVHFIIMRELFPELGNSVTVAYPHSVHNNTMIVPEIFDGNDLTWHPVDWVAPNVRANELQNCEFYGKRVKFDSIERFMPCDTSSPKSLQTARSWIETCNQEHGCTQQSVLDLPRRVLDVRNTTVRLREVSAGEKGDRYACLSHCWGNPPIHILRTTVSVLGAYKEEIPWQHLPKTFQDAINFTRKLGIPFLWIDSLCIIQDDKRDWEEQSAEMASIYQNAYITLAATASSDADGGCYTRKERPPTHKMTHTPVAIIQRANTPDCELYARRSPDHDMHNLPLLKRGWVYQERLLSSRVLHFNGEELVWECNTTIDCECGNTKVTYQMKGGSRFDKNNMSPRFPTFGVRSSRWWDEIVRDYTSLALTEPKDVFPALSGIARAFAKRTGDVYVAGIWKGTAVLNMLWLYQWKKGSRSICNQTQPWRAPSWSWASENFDGVWYRNTTEKMDNIEELAVVKNVSCESSGSDPTGEVTSAQLTLCTKTLSAQLRRSTDISSSANEEISDAEYIIEVENGFKIHKSPRQLLTTQVGTGYLDLNDARLARGVESLDIVLAQMTRWTGQKSVDRRNTSYMEDGSMQFAEKGMHIDQEIQLFLLLARHEDDSSQEEKWVRIGIASIAAYEPRRTMFGDDTDYSSNLKTEEALFRMSESDLTTLLAQPVEQNRAILRQFENTELQNFIMV